MKALVLERNGELVYKDVSAPKMADDECLISVKYSGVCSSDIYRAFCGGAYFYPLIMGHEFSGVVEDVGGKVKGIKKNDRVAIFPLIPCNKCVYCKNKFYAQCLSYDYFGSRRNGGFAEYVSVKPWNLFKIPDEVYLKDAALLEPLSVAVHALRKAQVKIDDTCLILGAGLIGLTLANLLSDDVKPKNIFIVDRNESKLTIAKKLGVNVINSSQDADWIKNLIMKTKGGVKFSFETCGSKETYRAALETAKSHGEVILAGNIDGDLNLDKKFVSSIIRRELKIQGCWNASFTKSKDDDWHKALLFIKSSKPSLEFISHCVGLSEGALILNKMFKNKFETNIKKKRNFPESNVRGWLI